MSDRNVRRVRQPGRQDPQQMFLLGLIGVVGVLAFSASMSLKVGFVLTGQGMPAAEVPWNPITLIMGLVKGTVWWAWPAVATLVVLWTLVVVGSVVVWMGHRRRVGRRTRVDAAAAQLASAKDIASMSKAAAQKAGRQWFSREVMDRCPGLRLGHIPGSKQSVFSTWEDLLLVLMGPRMGKSTAVVIPAMVDAPGVVVTTSNKRDIVDETVELMKSRGAVFVFDPQRIAVGLEQEPWFFDPLEMIRRDEAVMDAAALELADIFKCAARGENDSGDGYFRDGGRDLLARLLLAAALDGRPISDVFLWVNDEKDKTPVRILSQYPEWEQQHAALRGTYQITEKTRSGLFSQAAQMAAPLGRREAVRWVTPQAGARRFSPDDFVREGSGTLYVLSKEGADNAAALTTALTVAVMKAAEEYGELCGGRLPVPLLAALDEAANVVQWPQLPKVYSHYGSRGIIVMTVLQSYMQGEKVWGREGMELLWSAAGVVMVGGGIRDEKLLGKVEALIGDYEQVTSSVSRSRQGRSVSQQVREKKILTVAEIAAMEAWRVVLFATKRRPMIVALEPWWDRSWSREVTALLGSKSAGVVDGNQGAQL